MRVCMYACIDICVYACIRVCVYACMHVWTDVCMCVCVYACMRFCVLCLYACMDVCVYMCMCVCVYACMRVMHVCMYGRMCVYGYACICMYGRMHVCTYVCVCINGLPITDITLGDTLIAEPDDKVNAVLSIIGVPLSKDNYILTKFPLVEGRDTFSVKLTIDDIGTKNSILQNARKLKSTESLQKVYIKNDETRLARSENYRLRDKARKLRIQFPDTVVKIEKGKLLRDGVICDKFDINNQIFC